MKPVNLHLFFYFTERADELYKAQPSYGDPLIYEAVDVLKIKRILMTLYRLDIDRHE